MKTKLTATELDSLKQYHGWELVKYYLADGTLGFPNNTLLYNRSSVAHRRITSWSTVTQQHIDSWRDAQKAKTL